MGRYKHAQKVRPSVGILRFFIKIPNSYKSVNGNNGRFLLLGNGESLASKNNCSVSNLLCRSFSTHLQHLQHTENVELCNFLYEKASKTSRIHLYNMTVHYSEVPGCYNDSQRFSTFSTTRDFPKTQGKFVLYFVLRSLSLPLAVVLCQHSNFSLTCLMKYTKVTLTVFKTQIFALQFHH